MEFLDTRELKRIREKVGDRPCRVQLIIDVRDTANSYEHLHQKATRERTLSATTVLHPGRFQEQLVALHQRIFDTNFVYHAVETTMHLHFFEMAPTEGSLEDVSVV